MHPDIVDDRDDEEREARAEARAHRHYRQQLTRHPSCADPDHPGCGRCWDDEEDNEEYNEEADHE